MYMYMYKILHMYLQLSYNTANYICICRCLFSLLFLISIALNKFFQTLRQIFSFTNVHVHLAVCYYNYGIHVCVYICMTCNIIHGEMNMNQLNSATWKFSVCVCVCMYVCVCCVWRIHIQLCRPTSFEVVQRVPVHAYNYIHVRIIQAQNTTWVECIRMGKLLTLDIIKMHSQCKYFCGGHMVRNLLEEINPHSCVYKTLKMW